MIKQTLLSTLIFGLFMLISSHSNAQDNNRMYRIAKIKIDANQLEKYKTALSQQMNAAIQLEPGVLSYTAVADKKDATLITILEIYASPAAYQAHIITPHFKHYKETVKNMVLSLELIDTDLVVSAKQKDF